MIKLAAMDFYDISWQISSLLEGQDTVYLRTEPEIPDFTARAPFKMLLFSGAQRLEIEVNPDTVMWLGGLLGSTVFSKESVKVLYAWNLKAFNSYFRFFVSKFITPSNSIIDLKVIESFLGIKKNRPENLTEVINRARIALQRPSWKRLYKSIHMPLALRVLPDIETTPLLNTQSRKAEYPFYEIEGQINGRMNCSKGYAYSYLPHNLGPVERRSLKPRGYNLLFMTADFRHCEVTVLQWLTGDEDLGSILISGQDLHNKIYEVITEDPCDTAGKRVISKKMFLPVMYGLGPNQLARNLAVTPDLGIELHQRIQRKFSTSYQKMLELQQRARTEAIEDYFGRSRRFPEDKTYGARNFWVQGVAATACQEKLIKLHEVLGELDANIAFSVHDGYCFCFRRPMAKEVYRVVKETLESESQLCPGLRMKVEIKFGASLDEMKVLWK